MNYPTIGFRRAQKLKDLRAALLGCQKVGEWTVLTIIDSNGYEVEKTLISSVPKGFMTQSKVDEMPKSEFRPSESNKNRVSVKFYSTAKIAPKNEL